MMQARDHAHACATDNKLQTSKRAIACRLREPPPQAWRLFPFARLPIHSSLHHETSKPSSSQAEADLKLSAHGTHLAVSEEQTRKNLNNFIYGILQTTGATHRPQFEKYVFHGLDSSRQTRPAGRTIRAWRSCSWPNPVASIFQHLWSARRPLALPDRPELASEPGIPYCAARTADAPLSRGSRPPTDATASLWRRKHGVHHASTATEYPVPRALSAWLRIWTSHASYESRLGSKRPGKRLRF